MDTHNQQATFIPKRPVGSIGRRGIGFFSLIALIIFLSTLALSAGVFIWKYGLKKTVANQEKTLIEEKAKFKEEFVDSMVVLNSRIETAKKLLNNHVAVSSVFEALQRSTLKSVQFQSFSFTGVPGAGRDMIKVSMKGLARDYTSLAAQSEEIGKNQYIKEPIFSNFTLNEQGRVGFVLDAMIDPRLVDYRNRVEGTLWDSSETVRQPVSTSTATTTRQSSATTSPTNSNFPRP